VADILMREQLDAWAAAHPGRFKLVYDRARSHCRFVRPLIRFIPDSLTYSVPLVLKRQCDRTLGLRRGHALAQLHHRCQSEGDAVSAQKLGQLQPFIAVFPQECAGQLASSGPT
jgi:hypothetical protein